MLIRIHMQKTVPIAGVPYSSQVYGLDVEEEIDDPADYLDRREQLRAEMHANIEKHLPTPAPTVETRTPPANGGDHDRDRQRDARPPRTSQQGRDSGEALIEEIDRLIMDFPDEHDGLDALANATEYKQFRGFESVDALRKSHAEKPKQDGYFKRIIGKLKDALEEAKNAARF